MSVTRSFDVNGNAAIYQRYKFLFKPGRRVVSIAEIVMKGIVKAGTLVCNAGSAKDANGKCAKCPKGTFAKAGETKACADLKCPVGTTDHDSNPATPCVACNLGVGFTDKPGNADKCTPVRKCAAGKEAIPSRDKDAVCKDCASGTFRSSTMAQFVAKLGAGKACKAWSADCTAVCVDDANKIIDCSSCQSNCEKTSLQIAEPDATKDRFCLPCETGDTKPFQDGGKWLIHYFKDKNPAGKKCAKVAACKDDQEVAKAPTMVSDRQCRTCVYEGAKEYKDQGSGECAKTKVGCQRRSCPRLRAQGTVPRPVCFRPRSLVRTRDPPPPPPFP